MKTLDELLKDILPDCEDDDIKSQFSKLLNIVEKSSYSASEEPCDDTTDDCDELVSPCCNAALDMVFGTLPLEVRCLSCDKSYILSDLVLS